eukprot:TRINITY_DN28132_c0_g1_i1.p1 TRINITY_DN28132_c0_g1~~TRINITY_DN28132_c0_g1_i1.p1  ORF type:complete len:271 (-),score=44.33 TRINITY_DN28132_c0_g1_i1:112-852(-)
MTHRKLQGVGLLLGVLAVEGKVGIWSGNAPPGVTGSTVSDAEALSEQAPSALLGGSEPASEPADGSSASSDGDSAFSADFASAPDEEAPNEEGMHAPPSSMRGHSGKCICDDGKPGDTQNNAFGYCFRDKVACKGACACDDKSAGTLSSEGTCSHLDKACSHRTVNLDGDCMCLDGSAGSMTIDGCMSGGVSCAEPEEQKAGNLALWAAGLGGAGLLAAGGTAAAYASGSSGAGSIRSMAQVEGAE